MRSVPSCVTSALRLRIALAITAQLVVAAIWPTSKAHASGVISFRKDFALVMVVVPQVAIADGGFLALDTVYGARGRLLPPGWAIAQAIFGGFGSYVASAIIMPLDVGAGVGFAAFGTWFIGHSTASLMLHAREHPPQTSSGATQRSGPRGMPPPPRNDLTVVPIAHGAALVASGVF